MLFAVGVFWARHAATAAAEEAVREYGRNVDSGVLLSIIARWYFAPAAIIFAIASIAMFRAWRFRPAFHFVAWAWAALPFLLALASLLDRAVSV
ncbi:hypothetical protein GCM10027159_05110 [Lysobacter terrae]